MRASRCVTLSMGPGTHAQVVMDTLAVSHDEEAAQLLDGEHVMEWVQNVHARTRGSLDPTNANPNRADAASASLADASLVKLDGLLHVLDALTATWCAPRTPQPLATAVAAADACHMPVHPLRVRLHPTTQQITQPDLYLGHTSASVCTPLGLSHTAPTAHTKLTPSAGRRDARCRGGQLRQVMVETEQVTLLHQYAEVMAWCAHSAPLR